METIRIDKQTKIFLLEAIRKGYINGVDLIEKLYNAEIEDVKYRFIENLYQALKIEQPLEKGFKEFLIESGIETDTEI